MRQTSVLLSRLRVFLYGRLGHFIEAQELDVRLGRRKWLGALNDLINAEGYDIVTIPQPPAPPKFVLLKSDIPTLRFTDEISERTRLAIRKHNDLCCRACGRVSGDSDPTTPGRRVRLCVQQAVKPEKWVGPSDENIVVMCTACQEGFISLQIDSPTARALKVQVRRASAEDQLDLLAWLIRKFPHFARNHVDAS